LKIVVFVRKATLLLASDHFYLVSSLRLLG